jgi:hypothetical protein
MGSLSRPRMQGNGYVTGLVIKPRAVCCGAGGRLPIAAHGVQCGMSATGQSRHRIPICWCMWQPPRTAFRTAIERPWDVFLGRPIGLQGKAARSTAGGWGETWPRRDRQSLRQAVWFKGHGVFSTISGAHQIGLRAAIERPWLAYPGGFLPPSGHLWRHVVGAFQDGRSIKTPESRSTLCLH